jgi:hypothetical protein
MMRLVDHVFRPITDSSMTAELCSACATMSCFHVCLCVVETLRNVAWRLSYLVRLQYNMVISPWVFVFPLRDYGH